MFLAFFEPSFSQDLNYPELYSTYHDLLMPIELTIILFFIIDTFMQIYHKSNDKSKSLKKKLLCNPKLMSKIIVNSFFLSDIVYFYIQYPDLLLRYSRFLRPSILLYSLNHSYIYQVNLILYSKSLRRTSTGILKATRKMMELMAVLIVLILFTTLLGVRVIGDLDGQVEYDSVIALLSCLC